MKIQSNSGLYSPRKKTASEKETISTFTACSFSYRLRKLLNVSTAFASSSISAIFIFFTTTLLPLSFKKLFRAYYTKNAAICQYRGIFGRFQLLKFHPPKYSLSEAIKDLYLVLPIFNRFPATCTSSPITSSTWRKLTR